MGAESRPRAASERALARGYFLVQALGGAIWWLAVFTSRRIRDATLGTWDPAWLVGPDVVLFVGGSVAAATWGGSTRQRRWLVWVPTIWTILVTVALGGYGLIERTAGAGVVLMTIASVGSVAAASTLWWGVLPTGWFFAGPFRFREAAAGPPSRHLRRSLTQLVVFWTTFFALVPPVAVAIERRLRIDWPALGHASLRLVGIVVFLAASVLGLWSCVTMARSGQGTPLPAETARNLVTSGPYRLVRNPMAVAGAIQTIAIGLVWSSWIVVALAVAGAVAWDLGIRPVEEADLEARFGDDYIAYQARVRRWVPRPAPIPRGAVP